jgi:hypothetical protein
VGVEPVLRKAGGAIDSRFRAAGYGRRAMTVGLRLGTRHLVPRVMPRPIASSLLADENARPVIAVPGRPDLCRQARYGKGARIAWQVRGPRSGVPGSAHAGAEGGYR